MLLPYLMPSNLAIDWEAFPSTKVSTSMTLCDSRLQFLHVTALHCTAACVVSANEYFAGKWHNKMSLRTTELASHDQL